MLDDTRLRIFLVAAQTGNFTQTAKAMRITQPAVSQNISDIEKTYGIKLFERNRGAAILTRKGEVFKNYAESITNIYDELEYLFRNFREFDSIREVRLCSDEASMPWVTTVLMPYIYKVCPDATVCISRSSAVASDLKIQSKDGLRSIEASAAFENSALYSLLRTVFGE